MCASSLVCAYLRERGGVRGEAGEGGGLEGICYTSGLPVLRFFFFSAAGN